MMPVHPLLNASRPFVKMTYKPTLVLLALALCITGAAADFTCTFEEGAIKSMPLALLPICARTLGQGSLVANLPPHPPTPPPSSLPCAHMQILGKLFLLISR